MQGVGAVRALCLGLLVLLVTFAGVRAKDLPAYGNEVEGFLTVCFHGEVVPNHGLAVIPDLHHSVFTGREAHNFRMGTNPSCHDINVKWHPTVTAPTFLFLKLHCRSMNVRPLVVIRQTFPLGSFDKHRMYVLDLLNPLFDGSELVFKPFVIGFSGDGYVKPLRVPLTPQKNVFFPSPTFRHSSTNEPNPSSLGIKPFTETVIPYAALPPALRHLTSMLRFAPLSLT